jgi:hypothetical protein
MRHLYDSCNVCNYSDKRSQGCNRVLTTTGCATCEAPYVALIGHLEKLRFSPIKHTYLFDKQRTPFEENEFSDVPNRHCQPDVHLVILAPDVLSSVTTHLRCE